MTKKFCDDKKIEPGQERSPGAGVPSQGFYDTTMTALSLRLVSTSQNQQKTAVSPADLAEEIISAGWNTDLYDKNFFNNQKFDSAVFLRSSNFKRHHKNCLH